MTSKRNEVDLLKVAAGEVLKAVEARLGPGRQRGERLFPASFEASGSFTNVLIDARSIRIGGGGAGDGE